MKYFIENKEGQWLKDLDQWGEGCWTRDPGLAWGFSKKGEGIKGFQERFETRLWFDMEPRPDSAYDIMDWLVKEETIGSGLLITEHDFQEIFPMHYKDLDHSLWVKTPKGMYKVFSTYSGPKEQEEFDKDFKKDLLGF